MGAKASDRYGPHTAPRVSHLYIRKSLVMPKFDKKTLTAGTTADIFSPSQGKEPGDRRPGHRTRFDTQGRGAHRGCGRYGALGIFPAGNRGSGGPSDRSESLPGWYRLPRGILALPAHPHAIRPWASRATGRILRGPVRMLTCKRQRIRSVFLKEEKPC